MRRGALLLLFALAACGSGAAATEKAAPTSTTLEATTSTTALADDGRMPTAFELEIIEAYERSWEVYNRAVRYFDASELASIFAGRALELATSEVEELKAANTPARMDIRHGYRIQRADEDTVIVWDTYRNHSVLLDARTLKPIEPDPNSTVEQAYILTLIDGRWMVTNVHAAEDVNVHYEN